MYSREFRDVRRLHAVAVVALLLGAWLGTPRAQSSAGGTFKLAFYNIKSGKGQIALPGFPSTFADTGNCTNAQLPLNAWGVGSVQAVLRTHIAADPGIVALGLAEAWTCGSPTGVRGVLGWKAQSSERNGIALVARYGFAGPEQWVQLDTSLNANPADTMWVLRAPVCLDPTCSESSVVFTAHWYASGLTSGTPPEQTRLSFEAQARQTVEFLNREPALTPHVLIGDLNVFGGTEMICNQNPWNTPLRTIADAGYVDGWAYLHGAASGFTGMWNRPGCGTPDGNLWKRIDYSWSRHANPISMTRFGLVTPGYEAPSDHVGIVVEYPWPGVAPTPAPPAAPDPGAPAPAPAPAPPLPAGPPFGSMDAPVNGSAVAGEVAIGGWVLDDSGVVGVDIYRSPVPGEPVQENGLVLLGSASLVDGARPDVVNAYPAYPGASRAGWGYMLLSNLLPNRGNGTFTVSAHVRAADGGGGPLASKTITASNENARTPFGTIDTPSQGQTVSETITNFGWTLTPAPSSIPTDGSTIDVYVDGVFRGHPAYNNFRPDIAELFPGYANSTGAVGYFVLDTRSLANGVHTIAWVVHDTAGNAAGIGSRYFTVANP